LFGVEKCIASRSELYFIAGPAFTALKDKPELRRQTNALTLLLSAVYMSFTLKLSI